MVSIKLFAVAAAALRAFAVDMEVPEGIQVEELEELPGDLASDQQGKQANLAVDIHTSFPQSEIFGIKLVNGHSTKALLDISNHESAPITLQLVAGTLSTPENVPGAPDPSVVLRNLTTVRYGVSVPAGGRQEFTYTFAEELHPQELRLGLVAFLQNSEGAMFTKMVFNETVSVVEAPVSFFDPQIIFLYIFLAGAFGGTCYFIYNTWITTLFPQKKRGGKGGERAKRSTAGTKKVDPADQAAVIGADGPATTSGAKAYDESWIPAEHLRRPEAKRVGSGRVKSRAA